jgi:hypothetical protein
VSQAGSYILDNAGLPVLQTLTGNTGGAVPGSAGNNINVVGTGSVIVTGNPGTNTLTISNSITDYNYTNVATSPYTVLITDNYLSVDCSGGAIILKFPNAATLSQSWVVKDRTGSSATHSITLESVSGSVNIDGASTYVINSPYQAVNILGNGTTYEVF